MANDNEVIERVRQLIWSITGCSDGLAEQAADAVATALAQPSPQADSDAELDAMVRQHHRYRNLWEDFQTVEKDLRACALLVGHHYNSLRPVAPTVAAALNSPQADSDAVERLREIVAIVPVSAIVGRFIAGTKILNYEHAKVFLHAALNPVPSNIKGGE